jgi:hypothetical protein
LAERDVEEVASLADDFAESVTQFEAYQPRDQPFYATRKPDALKRWLSPGKPNTSRLAARIDSKGASTQLPLPPLTYVDRELVPSRTTSPARFERSLGTKLRLDLLFSNGGRPVVAEVKAVSDENVYYALIQGLALCAQLAPAAQRKRLTKRYPELNETGPLELWIILASHNSRGRDKAEMLKLSRDIAGRLLRYQRVAKCLSAIICVDAQIPASGPVLLTECWATSATS